jgi:hypothetical protein
MEDEPPSQLSSRACLYPVARYFVISLLASILSLLTLAFLCSLPDRSPPPGVTTDVELPVVNSQAVLHELSSSTSTAAGRCAGSVVWSSQQVDVLLQEHYPWLYRLYYSYPYQQQRTHVALYVILHRYGGVISLDGSCPAVHQHGDEVVHMTPTLLAAPAAHPLILCLLEELPWLAHTFSIFRYSTIRASTGPGLLQQCLQPQVVMPPASLSWLEMWERVWLIAALVISVLVTGVSIKVKKSLRHAELMMKNLVAEHLSWIVKKPVFGNRTLIGKKGLIQV